MTHPVILSIAGSDSSAGAGIQADIKTCAALGAYCATAVTAVTAQGAKGLHQVYGLPTIVVKSQIRVVCREMPPAATKIGMLANASIVQTVADELRKHELKNIVIDPVLKDRNGVALIDDEGVNAIKELLLPHASLVTPNLGEMATFLEVPPEDILSDRVGAAEALACSVGVPVLFKGGHIEGDECKDTFIDASGVREFSAPRVEGRDPHGTGCTLSTAIATLLGRGLNMEDAITKAKDYVQNAIREASQLDHIGNGQVSVHHFYWTWKKS